MPTHFHEERFRFAVVRTRNQERVQRVQDLLMLRDLVVDIGLVERLAVEAAQRGEVLFAARLQRAGR